MLGAGGMLARLRWWRRGCCSTRSSSSFRRSRCRSCRLCLRRRAGFFRGSQVGDLRHWGKRLGFGAGFGFFGAGGAGGQGRGDQAFGFRNVLAGDADLFREIGEAGVADDHGVDAV